jgi:hypothetical protein
MNGVRPALRRLARCCSGAAMVETALAMPLLLTLGLYGAEITNLEIMHMKVAQVAEHLADNASRIGDTSTLHNRKIYEGNINDIFRGSGIQGGRNLNFFEHGRAIISSLEVRPDGSGQQYIHWQRCKGKKVASSGYGSAGDDVAGMGPSGELVSATEGNPVIFVEVIYDYRPLVTAAFGRQSEIRAIAAFSVRDDRDISQIYQRNNGGADTPASCNIYSGVGSVDI